MWSSHWSVMSTLYLSLSCFLGALVNSHMPSSAKEAAGASSSAASSSPQVRRVIVFPLLVKNVSLINREPLQGRHTERSRRRRGDGTPRNETIPAIVPAG